ncbi:MULTISPECIES: hypothetical protein [Brevundimonas]|uniref:hypothetical protein n=1 Tax=Brevundimonas TaxID=41275 RepID=UPI0013CEACFC|nr:hypothetical protein [Brevundimonas lutea]
MILRTLATGLLLATAAAPALAQQADVGAGANMATSGTIEMRATTPEVCTVVSGVAEVTTVDLTTTSGQVLGDLTYVCNSISGFSRRIFSENNGALVRGDDRIAYRFAHGGAAPLALAPTELSSPVTTAVAPFGAITVGESGPVSVYMPGSTTGLLAGAYEDTVTVEITAE